MNPRHAPAGRALLALLPVLLTLSASAATLRVNPAATSATPDGLSWETAFTNLPSALTVARAGDEVWVAAGRYVGSFTLADGVALYGGFAATETAREQRNFAVNVSRLDGEGRTNLIVVANGAGPGTRVDGFTIENGLANATGTGGSGAGLRAINADPVIENNQFLNHSATVSGNAVFLQSSAATLRNNYFGFNGTSGTARDGGAVAVVSSSPRLEDNSFVGNRGRDGGAVHFSTSTGFLVGNWMLSNTATRHGGAVMCVSASPQVTHNRFLGNTAATRGGGVSVTVGSASLLFNNVFSQNSAATGGTEPTGGGGIFVDDTSQPSVVNNTLVLNRAPVGGLLLSNRNAVVANNLIAFGSSGIGGVVATGLQSNNVFGNDTNYVGVPDATGTAGNRSVDPKFAGDIKLAVVNILPDSPCRDAGDSTRVPVGALDIDGQPRIQGAAVDIGADETDGVTTQFLPAIVRVAPDGDDGRSGGDWTQAKRTVQAGIEAAGRHGGEVWVKTGTYVENVAVRPFTSLFGGFAGNETNRQQRNWRDNLTEIVGNRTTNVVRLDDLNFEETVDGFTVRDGSAVAGGAMYILGTVRIQNNRFVDNVATEPTVAGLARGGGALYIRNGSSIIANNVFLRNRALSNSRSLPAEGGAIKISEGSPSLLNNLFRMNAATNAFALGVARGGAIAVIGSTRPFVINNTFLANSATALSGTATVEQGGAVSFNVTPETQPPTSRFLNNLLAYNSSGASFSGGVPRIAHNLTWGNTRANYELIPDPTGTNGNLSLPPKLVGPYGDPHLASDSPARDAGDTSVVQADWLDLDGKSRVSGDSVDIGADEYDGTVYEIAPRIFYAAPEGDDARPGTTWATAKKSVGAALAAAALEGGEVWVKTGTYRERVRVELFTYLYGGFQGNETQRTNRNWNTRPTILDGGANSSTPLPGASVVSVIGTDGYAAVDGFTIQNGAARFGGGLNILGSPVIAHNLIRFNVAVSGASTLLAAGGGLYATAGSPTIANNVFVGNRTPTNSTLYGRGGALYFDTPSGSLPRVVHNTFLDNTAASGGGLFLATGTTARIANNIVAFGSSGLAAASPGTVATFNCVFGNATNDYAGIAAGSGSLSADPRLVAWRSGNYRLRADSPCLEAGDPTIDAGTLDFYAEPRRVAERPDLGADEFSGPAQADFELVLSSPTANQVFVAPATVFLSAMPVGGTSAPAYIEYLANDQPLAVATTAPFEAFAPNLVAGEYHIVARAVTTTGAMRIATPVDISVRIPPGNVPPVPTFSTPRNDQKFASPATVRATFSWTKPGGRVIAWDLFANDALIASNPQVPDGTTSATHTLAGLNTGNYRLTVIVMDNVGAKGTNAVNFEVLRGDPLPSVASAPQRQPDGSVVIQFSTPSADADYVLESTTDFKQWTPRSTTRGPAPIILTIPAGQLKASEAFRTRGSYP
ncbi:MAG: hypothetical protein HS113_05635 [Verrucomicrobiales bacterium]|nr:hypothetical protein [Verrucomicrobiales bacterium]